MKILYVEDNDDNVYMLKNRLSRAGFTVVVATNGAQGIAMATSEQPDLILMDLTLPDIRGEEATRRIKADPATKRIPVIALTANVMAGDKEHALAAGCDARYQTGRYAPLARKNCSTETSLTTRTANIAVDFFAASAHDR
jgi:CheY-like chemotaxis protein